MALLKKVKLPDDPAPDAEEPLDPESNEPAEGDESVTMDPLGENAAEAEATAPAEGGDALLDMFSTVGVHVEDRTLLLGLAGEVEIDDLISELSIVAAALGIVQAQRETATEPEQLAA